jgi:orotidine-5'-phosphate decarboxylase
MNAELIVALDTDDLDTAAEWVRQLTPAVSWFKVGLQMFVKYGHSACRLVTDSGGRLFLDLKFHDIPNTVAGAVASAQSAGAGIMTVHASGGQEMLRQAVQAAGQDTLIAAVTVLTSLDAGDLKAAGVLSAPEEQVLRLARLARNEVAIVRQDFTREELKLVVPGIRPADRKVQDDQKRTLTPAEAVRAGADFLVVGRPITQAPDPLAAAKAILAEIA